MGADYAPSRTRTTLQDLRAAAAPYRGTYPAAPRQHSQPPHGHPVQSGAGQGRVAHRPGSAPPQRP
eukprot:7022335-Lingulodinium_polyedra.AAC.1